MSYLAKVAALEASNFRQACGLPPRAELASPAAFAAALTALGKVPDPAWNVVELADVLIAELGIQVVPPLAAPARVRFLKVLKVLRRVPVRSRRPLRLRLCRCVTNALYLLVVACKTMVLLSKHLSATAGILAS